MQVATFRHDPRSGWSVPAFPDLDSERTLLLLFGGSAMLDDPGPIPQLLAAYPRACAVGCSGAGEILGGQVNDHTLAVAVARFDTVGLRCASAPLTSAGSYDAGLAVARRLGDGDEPLRGILVFSEGVDVNGSELVRGLNDGSRRSDAPIVCSGGLAGDDDRFERTWVLDERRGLRRGVVSAVGLYGEGLLIGHGSKGGWDIFGPERLVTRSEGNVLYELDGAPALQLYKNYLGDRASGLPATGLLFPLAIRAGRDDPDRLVRTILGVDEATGSLRFAGDMPLGWHAQLMRANFDRLIGGAHDAALSTLVQGGEQPLVVAISCVGRRLVLGERAEEEVEATLEALPAGSQQIGFYSYGEISPGGLGSCDLHNQTMTLTTLAER